MSSVKTPRVSNHISTELGYMDTNSLIYKVKAKLSDSIYDIIERDCSEYFDISDYLPDNVYGIPQVNKRNGWGMMKDELNGPILSHVHKVKKAKGVGGSAVGELIFEDYCKTLFENRQNMVFLTQSVTITLYILREQQN